MVWLTYLAFRALLAFRTQLEYLHWMMHEALSWPPGNVIHIPLRIVHAVWHRINATLILLHLRLEQDPNVQYIWMPVVTYYPLMIA